MTHVFLSYVREDSNVVDTLNATLKVFEIETWLDRERILPGHRWQDAIRQAIHGGAFFIACFSGQFVTRERSYMNEELVLAVEELRKRPTHRAWFLPVLLTPCQVPERNIGGGETLRALQHVSLYDDWNKGIQQILSVLKPSSATVDRLIRDIRSPSARVRVQAADQLGLVGGIAVDQVVPALVQALRDDHVTVRGVAADSLGKIGHVNEDVIVGMLRMAWDETRYGWGHAEEALKCFGAPAVPFLIKYLDSDRSRASLGLRELAEHAHGALPSLIRRVGDEGDGLIVQTLAKIGDPSALPTLLNTYDKARRDSNLHPGDTYAKAIAAIVDGGPDRWDSRDREARKIADRVLRKWKASGRVT